MAGKYNVLGLGALMIDRVLSVSNEFIAEKIDGERGGMVIISREEMEEYFGKCGVDLPKLTLGGSEGNTISVLADFGHKCGFIARVGDDEDGVLYEQNYLSRGVYPVFLREPNTFTGQCLSFVTPDAQRTMRTYLGASADLVGKDLKPEMFEGVDVFHMVSYSYMNKDLVHTALRLAKEAGAKVSFGLGCFEISKNFRDDILEMLDNYVDIVFGNEDEAKALTGKDEQESCKIIGDLCEVSVVHIGKRGCWIRRDRGKEEHFAVTPVKPIDSTGAGDMFAAGFLHGYLNGDDTFWCAEYGMHLGAAVVQMLGTDITQETWKRLLEYFNTKNKLCLRS
jgi:sugar/nucleoside kinase (ribokinase family)